jgi:hypothetical protein
MATYNKIADFVEHVNEGVHNMASHQLVVALSNTAPASETPTLPTADGGGILANVTQIAYTNLSTRNITLNTSSQTGGTYTLSLDDLTLSATGTVAQFRYLYVYNDTPTAPADPLVCQFDYGSALDLTSGESLTIDWGSDGGTTGTLYTMT